MSAVKILAQAQYRVVGMMERGRCPAEDFIANGDAATLAARVGLADIIDRVAEEGLESLPGAMFHQVNKAPPIYEFIKRPLRLLFFKGKNGDVAVCTGGFRKTSDKVDPQAVRKAVSMYKAYMSDPSQIVYKE